MDYQGESLMSDIRFSRTEMLFGNSINLLAQKKVIVFGIGGVGGYVCEALARTNVGFIDLVDNDVVSESNINRQIIALTSTIGKYKVDVMKDRILDINPKCTVNVYKSFVTKDNISGFDLTQYDYVVDAIDTISTKILLAEICNNLGVNIISSMGTGNKLDPTKFEVADINKTSECPLAKVMRYELKKRGIPKLKVVYSKEKPLNVSINEHGRNIPGSNAFCPSSAGLLIAKEVIMDLIKK